MDQDRCIGQLIVSTLLKDLPPELDLNYYFDGHPQVDSATRDSLSSHPSTLATGHLGLVLARYGIFPAQIVDVLGTVSRTVHRFQQDNQLPENTPIRVGAGTMAISEPPTLDWLMVLDAVVNITDLETVIANRLLMWLYAVAAIKPFIIPGFIYQSEPPYWWAMPGGIYPNCVNDLYEPWSRTDRSHNRMS